MRFPSFRSIAIIGLTVTFAACAKPKKADTEVDPNAGAGTEAGVSDRPITTDPMGSDSGNIPGLSTIYFEYDQARLTDDARNKLKENAEWIKGNASATVQIEGHTDERGSVEYNLSLGERRAKSVKSYLESLGVDAKRMTIISYGEEKPIAQGDGDSTWSKNRRANFVPIQ